MALVVWVSDPWLPSQPHLTSSSASSLPVLSHVRPGPALRPSFDNYRYLVLTFHGLFFSTLTTLSAILSICPSNFYSSAIYTEQSVWLQLHTYPPCLTWALGTLSHGNEFCLHLSSVHRVIWLMSLPLSQQNGLVFLTACQASSAAWMTQWVTDLNESISLQWLF